MPAPGGYPAIKSSVCVPVRHNADDLQLCRRLHKGGNKEETLNKALQLSNDVAAMEDTTLHEATRLSNLLEDNVVGLNTQLEPKLGSACLGFARQRSIKVIESV